MRRTTFPGDSAGMDVATQLVRHALDDAKSVADAGPNDEVVVDAVDIG